MPKSQDEGGNNAYQIFASQVEEGNISNTISYVELSMTAMKIKNNFCNESQYEMQKIQNGGGNNAYKIFTSRVVEGNNPNTTSHMELFVATMKMKNDFCDGYQYKMEKSRDGGGHNAFKIFMSWVKEGKYYIKLKYLVWSCS